MIGNGTLDRHRSFSGRYYGDRTPIGGVVYLKSDYPDAEQRAATKRVNDVALNIVSPRTQTPAMLYHALTDRTGLERAFEECEHGRLRGDPCPQPAMVPGGVGEPRWIPNPLRTWGRPWPCSCWGEARVTSPGPTPDPFSGITRARHTHGSVTDSVGRPRVQV